MLPEEEKEFQIIKKLLDNKQLIEAEYIDVPNGDDAVVLSTDNISKIVISQDSIVEGVHFDLKFSSFEDIAYKLVNINISDIVSMGGEPLGILITAGFDSSHIDYINKEFIPSLKTKLIEENIKLLGGDITLSQKIFFSATLIGRLLTSESILRYKANIGDVVFITGYTGISALGLWALKNNVKIDNRVLNIHKRATHRRDLLEIISKIDITSMTDISDSLYIALKLLIDENKDIVIDTLPIADEFDFLSDMSMIEDFILYGGEDFELVFTAPKSEESNIIDLFKKYKKNIFKIGYVKEGRRRIIYKDKILKDKGFRHF